MKYKLLKRYPSLPKDWDTTTIVTKTGKEDEYVSLCPHSCKFLSIEEVESSPEYFAPFVFTTLDEKNIFVGDTFYFIDSNNEFCLSGIASIHSSSKISGKVFSTKEAAQKYIKEQNKFKKGEWVYYNSNFTATLWRYSKDSITPEGYQISHYDGSIYYHVNTSVWRDKYPINKATPLQIESILTAVAIHKGFKEYVRYTIDDDFKWSFPKEPKYKYCEYGDELSASIRKAPIYKKGIWATIVEDKVPEYVECLDNSIWPNGIKIGEIFKTDSKNRGFGDRYRIVWPNNGGMTILPSQEYMFKPSTEEAYLKQYISTKVDENQITMALNNGKFTGVVLEDKVVKINYTIR